MPRVSFRQKVLNKLQKELVRREEAAAVRLLLSQSDSIEDQIDSYLDTKYRTMCSLRYLMRKKSYRKRRGRLTWDEYLKDDSTLMNDTEFLRTFRMSRRSFRLLEAELKETQVFSRTNYYGKRPRPLYQQLLVFLYRSGRAGSAGSCHEVGLYFGIASGSVRNYISNIVNALMELEEEVVSWPTEEEKRDMKVRLAATGFRHCIGIIDGTLIPLTRKPKLFHEAYYSRKCFYAINVLVVCDDKARILYYYAGWPGSTHDARVFRLSQLYRKREDYFQPMEYLIGDAAYSNSSIMVQAFRKARNEGRLPRNKELFNTLLARVRIKSEHCIGMLKGRFQCLRGMNTYIKEGEKEVKEIVDMFTACSVLHNLLISYEDVIPQEWYEELVEQIDFDVADEIENEGTVTYVTADEASRRDAVYNSIVENFI